MSGDGVFGLFLIIFVLVSFTLLLIVMDGGLFPEGDCCICGTASNHCCPCRGEMSEACHAKGWNMSDPVCNTSIEE